MSLIAKLPILLAAVCVSVGLIGTMAEETNCLEARILEKVISIEFKGDLALERLNQLTKTPEETTKSAERHVPSVRPALQGHTDALRVVDLEYGGWELVFRATAGNGQNVYNAWTNGEGTQHDNKPESMERSNAFNYRSLAVSTWGLQNINLVKFALYNRDKEVAYVIFDGRNSDLKNWFAKSRVISSSWSDLTPLHEFNYFSIDGHVKTHDRRFFINRSYSGCNTDLGYIAVLDTLSGVVCEWDRQPVYPQFLFSQINSVDYSVRFGRADYMAIFIKTA